MATRRLALGAHLLAMPCTVMGLTIATDAQLALDR